MCTYVSLHFPEQMVRSFHWILETLWGPKGLTASNLKDGLDPGRRRRGEGKSF